MSTVNFYGRTQVEILRSLELRGYIQSDPLEKKFECRICGTRMQFAEVKKLRLPIKDRPTAWESSLLVSVCQDGMIRKFDQRHANLEYKISKSSLANTVWSFHHAIERFLYEREYLDLGVISATWLQRAIRAKARLKKIEPLSGIKVSDEMLSLASRSKRR